MTVNVDVTDARGRAIAGLTAADFRVYEDDRIQTLTAVEREIDLPLTLALVGDASVGTESETRFVREAASGILQSLIRSTEDRALVIAYGGYRGRDTSVTLMTGPTNDRTLLRDIADGFPSSLGRSAMHSALVLAARLLAPLDGRRIIVLIGAGIDNTPRFNLEDSLLAVRQSGATVFAVRANSRLPVGMQTLGATPLRRLSEETGGRAFMSRRLGDLADFDNIAQEIRSRYRLTYQSDKPASGEFRRVRIEVPGRDVIVRAATGYDAMPYREFEVNFNVAPPLDGPDALGLAARGGHLERVEELVEGGAELDLPDDAGKTPLYLASQNGHEPIVETLLAAGARTDLMSIDGISALIVATAQGSENIVRRLIEGGAEVDLATPTGVTALLTAGAAGDHRLVEMLLERGAQVDLPSRDGVTPLIAASRGGHPRVVRQLLDADADLSLATPDGQTALDVALENGHAEIVELLEEFAARR